MARKYQFSKVGIVCVVLVMALGLSGITYGGWSSVLNITGTVETGTYSAVFNKAVSNDPGTENDPIDQGNWSLVSGVPVWSGSTDPHTASTGVTGAGTDTLTVSLSNAYPCYWGSVGVTIKNTGTVPMKVNTVDVSVSSVGDPDPDTNLQIFYTGALVEANHVKINPGDEALGSAHFHPVDPAPTGSNYTVTITVTVTW